MTEDDRAAYNAIGAYTREAFLISDFMQAAGLSRFKARAALMRLVKANWLEHNGKKDHTSMYNFPAVSLVV